MRKARSYLNSKGKIKNSKVKLAAADKNQNTVFNSSIVVGLEIIVF